MERRCARAWERAGPSRVKKAWLPSTGSTPAAAHMLAMVTTLPWNTWRTLVRTPPGRHSEALARAEAPRHTTVNPPLVMGRTPPIYQVRYRTPPTNRSPPSYLCQGQRQAGSLTNNGGFTTEVARTFTLQASPTLHHQALQQAVTNRSTDNSQHSRQPLRRSAAGHPTSSIKFNGKT